MNIERMRKGNLRRIAETRPQGGRMSELIEAFGSRLLDAPALFPPRDEIEDSTPVRMRRPDPYSGTAAWERTAVRDDLR